MGCRLLWWAQAMLSGSLKQGGAGCFWKIVSGVAAESVPFSFDGMGGQTLTKQVEL